MTKAYWIGGAAVALNQAESFDITADDVATTYGVTIGGVSVSVLGSGVDADTTAAALQVALAASTHPYFAAITFEVDTATITMTAAVAGVPFEATPYKTGGTGTISAVTVDQANAGPNDFNSGANWVAGTVPADDDELIFADGDVPLLWGLFQAAKAFTIRKFATMTGAIGLNPHSFATSATTSDDTVPEYRQTHLKPEDGVTASDINQSDGTDVSPSTERTNINLGGVVDSIHTVWTTAPAALDGSHVEPVHLLGNHASIKVNTISGIVGIATLHEGVDTSTLGTINATGTGGGTSSSLLQAAFNQAGTSGATVRIGSGVTLTNVNTSPDSRVINQGADIAAVNNRGRYIAQGGAHTAIVNEGSVDYYSTGAIGTLTTSGRFSRRGDPRPLTIGTLTLQKGFEIDLDTGVAASVVITNPIAFDGCGIEDGTVRLGRGFALQLNP